MHMGNAPAVAPTKKAKNPSNDDKEIKTDVDHKASIDTYAKTGTHNNCATNTICGIMGGVK
jgi:hypothetical protein